ncbi:O-acyltransferase like protein-like [Ochlerotatus camptorhynchus]|uniref:O-acyltransferase like protein-like n=1 Tax=Ochlerotatus camptorhynchus TaxID=644619 RepID=UPI0031D34141
MPKRVLIVFEISLLILSCNFLFAHSNESYDGKNQSAIAITKNKYQPITRHNASIVAPMNVISESKDSNLHSNVEWPHPHVTTAQSDINLQDEANTGVLVGPDKKVDEIMVYTPLSSTRNSFPKEPFLTTSLDIRNIHDNMQSSISTDESNAYKQMVSKNERTTDGMDPADRVSTKKIYKYIRKGAKNQTYGNLPIPASVMSDQEMQSNPTNYFHLFMNLYDHHSWDISVFKNELSYDCAVDMDIYLAQLVASQLWAMQVCDSSGRYGGLSFFGNDYWLGSKSSCEEVNHQYSNENQSTFVEMRFYVATIKVKIADIMPEVKPLQLGECLPKTCSIRDIYKILQEDPTSKKILESNNCQTMNSTNHSPSCSLLDITNLREVPGSYSLFDDSRFYLLSSTLIVLVTTVIFATYYESSIGGTKKRPKSNDRGSHPKIPESELKFTATEKLVESDKAHELIHISRNNNFDVCVNKEGIDASILRSTPPNKHIVGIISDILLCFAAGSNSKTILSVAKASKDSLTCIHGMRLYSLLWTIMVHTYLQLFAVGENRVARKITERSFSYQIVGNATFSVDTFFFISGVLVVVLYFRSAKNEPSKEKQNSTLCNPSACSKILFSILYRFIRLTPAYLFVIIFNELALKWTYGRSVFTPGIIDHITCNKYWWRNILYINNWYSFSEMCMIWSWYLANDMQFYVVAIIVLTISSRYMKTSAFLLGY